MFQEQTGIPVATAPPDRRRTPRHEFRQQRRTSERIHLLGEPIDLVRREELMQQLEQWVGAGHTRIIANHNLHSLYLIRREPEMRAMYDRADLIELDSTPLVHFARFLGLGTRGFHRCTYLDWREHFWSLANRKRWRVMYVGGACGVAETAAGRLSARYPGVVIGTRDGYFDAAPGSAGNAATVAAVQAFQPDVLMVGMGMPRQEAWIARNRADLPPTVILPVGAAFDYEAGAQRAAPRWMGRFGLEWLFRLVVDPRRLFVRYCVEPWFLIGPAFADVRAARRRASLKGPSGDGGTVPV